MKGQRLDLARSWVVGERIGGGGFGEVYAVLGDDGNAAVAKFVRKTPGAERELLFVNLADARNVVPVIDSGEHDDSWVLVMPRADQSLRDYLVERKGVMSLADAVVVLEDIADALIDLADTVVHRDLKPENVLLLNGHWCLADFGISRYAEASTAADTRKLALSPPYAAPERWRTERASAATDVYAMGVIGYELLAARLPFVANSAEDFRDMHLHADPPPLVGVPTALATLIEECLFKAAETRPTPANFRARLRRHQTRIGSSPGVGQLEEANHAEVQRRATAARHQSEARSESERRSAILGDAKRALDRIGTCLREQIVVSAPSVIAGVHRDGGWSLRLGTASLTFSPSAGGPFSWGGWHAPAFDVASVASIALKVSADRSGYEGRSHSLWFGDIARVGEYGWYETAFMFSPFVARQGRQEPFALDPGRESAQAVGSGMAEFQTAWPFMRLEPDDLYEFIDRWAAWLARASRGELGRPSSMPEHQPQGTWR